MGTIKEKDIIVSTIIKDFKAYEIEKIAARQKISRAIVNSEFDVAQMADDVMNDVYTAMVKCAVYTHTVAKPQIIFYAKPPSFLDWLLRRKRKLTFEVELKEILTDLPNDLLLKHDIKFIR